MDDDEEDDDDADVENVDLTATMPRHAQRQLKLYKKYVASII